jgi:hypothetical protein
MKITATIKNVSEHFFSGFGESIVGLNNLDDREKLNYLLNRGVSEPWSISTKVGNGSFSDRIALNQLRRKDYQITYKLENRKGYKLATFDVSI